MKPCKVLQQLMQIFPITPQVIMWEIGVAQSYVCVL